jgi:hypothetical protein
MTTVILYTSEDAGAPVLTNAAGSLIALLDACLLTGYGTVSVSSITVAAGVATVQSAGHGFVGGPGRHVDIVGATPAALSGRKAVTRLSADSFSYAVSGVADGTYTGAISARRAAAGWSKPAVGTNIAIYRRPDPAATAMTLWIESAGGTGSTVRSLESFVSATDLGPYTSAFWNTGPNTAAARSWALVASPRGLWFFSESSVHTRAAYPSTRTQTMSGWVDLIPKRAGDAYHTLLLGDRSLNSIASAGYEPPIAGSYRLSHFWIQRGVVGLPGGVRAAWLLPTSHYDTPGQVGPLYPDAVSLGLDLLTGTPIIEPLAAFGHPVRGRTPGLAWPLQRINDGLDRQTVVVDGRAWMCFTSMQQRGDAPLVHVPVFVDLAGPWY